MPPSHNNFEMHKKMVTNKNAKLNMTLTNVIEIYSTNDIVKETKND